MIQKIISTCKKITILIMSFFYIGIGLKHFSDPSFFLKIMPPYLPWHLELIYLSGFFEIILGGLLLIHKYRFYAGWGLIILLVLVFPANVYVYTFPEILSTTQDKALIRMFFQIPLIIIAYWHSIENERKWLSYLALLMFFPTIFYFINLSI